MPCLKPSPTINIRRARTAEADLLQNLAEDAFSVYIERIGRRPAPMDDDYLNRIRKRQAFVAESAGTITGLIVLVVARDCLVIETVAVRPVSQGTGVGGALLAHAERYARARGMNEIRLYTNAAMRENLVMYPRLGFREVARQTEHGFERVFFSKILSP